MVIALSACFGDLPFSQAGSQEDLYGAAVAVNDEGQQVEAGALLATMN